jgi:hypothetical protein
MNTSGAAIALVTAFLIGLLLATRISLAAGVPRHPPAVRRPRPRDVAVVGARLRAPAQGEDEGRDRAQASRENGPAPQLRLVPNPTPSEPGVRGPIVREVNGRGSFQIRKVTKADLRKAAEALSQQETPDPFELYPGPSERRLPPSAARDARSDRLLLPSARGEGAEGG